MSATTSPELAPASEPATPDCTLECCNYVSMLDTMSADSCDLVLTDPPYTISKKTGFEKIGKNSVERFAVSMDFGAWDKEQIDLTKLAEASYRALRKGGTAIIFYDVWKISYLSQALEQAGFKMIRLIIWQKKNPVPLNSKRSYLTNSREIAVVGVKGGKPTFHSEYDNGVYQYPIPNNGKRYHPTQKPLELFVELIKKHSDEGQLIVDPFVGSGTTALACLKTGRKFLGCDINKDYINIARQRIERETIQSKLIP